MSCPEQIAAELTQAAERGETVALATVVRVVGSAYRGVGARLVVRADGSTLGLVSGGCLEGDLAARADEARTGGRATLVTYDTRSGDDLVWGLGLGCDGVVEVLLEPLVPERARAVATLLREAATGDAPAVLLTLARTEAPARLLLRADGTTREEGAWPDALRDAALVEARALLADAEGVRGTARSFDDTLVAIEPVAPAPALLICGAGPDAAPLARLALSLGWEVTVVDHREPGPVHPSAGPGQVAARFPGAQVVRCADAVRLGDVASLGARTCAVVMSHHYERDLHYLHALLASDVRYVGLLGPRARAERLLAERRARLGARDDGWDSRLHAPVGLDLGGDGPEAVALAIAAEVMAAANDRAGGRLRDREGPIHAIPNREMRESKNERREVKLER